MGQAGEAGQGGRYVSGQPVAVESKPVEVGEAAQR